MLSVEQATEARRAITMPTQRRLVLDYLLAGRRLSNLIAITNLGVGSLTSRVAELRRDGYNIQSETKSDHGGKRYVSYWLDPADAKPRPSQTAAA